MGFDDFATEYDDGFFETHSLYVAGAFAGKSRVQKIVKLVSRLIMRSKRRRIAEHHSAEQKNKRRNCAQKSVQSAARCCLSRVTTEICIDEYKNDYDDYGTIARISLLGIVTQRRQKGNKIRQKCPICLSQLRKNRSFQTSVNIRRHTIFGR